MSYPFRLDAFSGDVTSIKRKDRTEANVLAVLRKSPRVSVWDMDMKWLRDMLARLEIRGLIEKDDKEPYPWIRYVVKS